MTGFLESALLHAARNPGDSIREIKNILRSKGLKVKSLIVDKYDLNGFDCQAYYLDVFDVDPNKCFTIFIDGNTNTVKVEKEEQKADI